MAYWTIHIAGNTHSLPFRNSLAGRNMPLTHYINVSYDKCNADRFWIFHCIFQINKREAFLKGDTPGGKYEAPSTKFDPSLRERDGKAEKIEKSAPPPKAEKPDIKLENHRPAVNRSESSKSLEGYVGFANLPNQVYRKSVKRGFEFTMMVVGTYSVRA